MTTSNNTTWELTLQQIVEAAYRKTGYLGEGVSLTADALANGVQALNAVLSGLSADGMPLWKRVTLDVPLVVDQINYTIGSSLKIPQVVLKDIVGGTQYPLIEKSLYDFNRLPDTSVGIPVHFTYQPTLMDGTLTIWPIPDATAVATKSLAVVYQRKFDGFFNAAETPDFPPYWTQAIIFGLALAVAPEHGVPLGDRTALENQFKFWKDMADGGGDEDGSLFIMPDYYGKRT